MATGDLEAWLTRRRGIHAKEVKLASWTFVAQVPHKVMIVRFQFKHHVAPLLLLGCLHALHSPSVTYGGLLVS